MELAEVEIADFWLSTCQSGACLHRAGRGRCGQGYLREALKESSTIGHVPLILEVLVGVALLRAKAGPREREQAAELLGLVLGHPAVHEDARQLADPVLAVLRDVLPPDELDAAMARGKALDLEQVVEEILAQLEE